MNPLRNKLRLAVLTLVSLVGSNTLFASSAASDNASNPAYQANDGNNTNDSNPANNTNGWVAGDNGGSGFGAWTLTATGAGGRYTGATGDGNTGTTFGLFAGNTTDSSSADRPFTGAMIAGDKFSLDLGTTNITTPGVVGFNLLDGTNPVFTFKFTGGGTFWQLNDGSTDFNTNLPFSANTPINFAFTYNGGATYSVLITEGATTYTGNGFTAHDTISNITGARFFSNQQGGSNNFGFNDLTITPVPEPSSVALLGGPAILGAWFYFRRRRV